MSTTAKHGIYIRPRSTLPSAVLATTSSHGATAPLIDMRSHQRIGVEILARGNQVVHPNPTDPSRSVWIVELQVDIVEWHIVGGLWLAVLSGAVMHGGSDGNFTSWRTMFDRSKAGHHTWKAYCEKAYAVHACITKWLE